MMPAAAVGPDGRLWALWASDLRSAKSALPQQGRVYLSNLGVGGAGSELALKPWTPESTGTVDRIHPNESKQVERIRSYRIQSQGKSYSIFRGDLHRHTDIPWMEVATEGFVTPTSIPVPLVPRRWNRRPR